LQVRRFLSSRFFGGPLASAAGTAALVLIVAGLLGPVTPALWVGAGLAALAVFSGLRAVQPTQSECGAAEIARLLAGHAADGVLRLGRDGCIRFASAEAGALLGKAPLDLHRHCITEFAAGPARAEVQAALARTSYFGAETSVTFPVRGRSAGPAWAEMQCRPLFPDDKTPRDGAPAFEMAAALRDVTAQIEREQALATERDAALAEARTKAQFLANMSHELRTPLNAIIGFSEVMTTEMFGPLGSARYAEYANHIKESGEHLRDLINDVLDVSKVEAGRFELELERVSVPMVFEETLKLVSVTAKKHKVALDVEFPEGLPRVTADRRAVKQILLNLLSNAIKFTPDGGTVTAAARADRGAMVIEVRDTGRGIPKADLARLAQPYEQGSRARGEESAADKGTGLGLTLVKAFAGLHGGKLESESEEGVGTIVRVRLPLEGPRGARPVCDAPAPVDLPSRRVA
jgi:cell cycle sensor histidine kinase DivJ